MNILFYTHGKVYSTRGGTERSTISVASSLTRYFGCRCFSLYEVFEDMPIEPCFEAEFLWQAGHDRKKDIEILRKLVLDNKVDFIIDQGIFVNVKLLAEAVSQTNCKIILAHHYSPGAESSYMSFMAHWKNANNNKSWRNWCRWLFYLIFYPYAKHKYGKQLRLTYKEAYRYADKVVLLSKNYVEPYQTFGRFNDDSKFVIIPNSLSFNTFISEEELNSKKKVVLIVSRIEEIHKRLSMALDIWARVKQSPLSKDWVIKFVGTGSDFAKYKKMIQHRQIPNVRFEGRQDPVPYYKEASLFMMTSSSESWGLTLTEAQQMGAIPIAFNTYASLSDIITDGEDGLIIEEGNVSKYVDSVLELMKNDTRRQIMAMNAVHNCKRFSQDKVVRCWWDLLNS